MSEEEADVSLLRLFHKTPFWTPAVHRLFGVDFNRMSCVILFSAGTVSLVFIFVLKPD